MLADIPKISVLVITYNQEDVISRSMESLLAQKDYIYEICVSDDCSKDKTWDILQNYSTKYPGLFKLNRNEPNLGIFENVEKTWEMSSGDIIYTLAGDDECGAGWFKRVVDFIKEKKIDYKKELFCIYSDYKAVYPNGDSYVTKCKMAVSGINALKLSLRGIIGNRGTCYSKRIQDKFIKVSQGKSHIAEDAQDRQLQFYSKKNYYIPHIGNIYYANIGVCIKIDDSVLSEREKIRPYAISKLQEWGAVFDKSDLIYSLKFFNAFHLSNHHPSIKNRMKAIYWYIRSYDKEIGLRAINVKKLIFLIIKRFPHKSPINW